MKRKYELIIAAVLSLVIILVAVVWLSGANIAVMNPQGLIAHKQRDLIIVATLLMMIVVIPVYILTFGIAWKYRASNKKAKYSPNLDGNAAAEAVWWLIPLAIITILGGIIWTSSHELDPFKPLQSDKKPVTIQVVAMQWKWLFIYPEENIATVNYVQFPEKTPINFQITSDAPMNSFWIPSLGGQIYAMSGMSTKLHLMADKSGTYQGSSANISGKGFAGMKFTAKSTTDDRYESWVQRVKSTGSTLDESSYAELAKPSTNNKVQYYMLGNNKLYDTVIMKYMEPSNSMEGMGH